MSNPYKTIYELRETIAELSERCREQEADIEELLKEREWISVKDRLPDEGENVLTYGARPFYDVFYVNRLIDKKNGEWLYDGVTHWMPLPQKPESEDDANGKDDRGS